MTWHSVSQLRSILYGQVIRRVEAQVLNWIEANTWQVTVTRDPRTLTRLVAELKGRRGIAYVVLSDREGRVLAQAGVPSRLSERVAPEPVAGTISKVRTTIDESRRQFVELITPIRSAGTGMNPELDSMFALAAKDQSAGTILTGIDPKEIRQGLETLIPQNVALYAALVLMALGISIAWSKRMVTPITTMGRVANQIAAGNLEERVRSGAELQDEVGELVRNFNRMADRLAENRVEMNLLYAGLEEKVRERTLELQEANRKLQELDELKSQFLSTVSHELRTPLTSIKAFSEILLDSPPDAATGRRFLEIIDKESDRLSRLISDLLDLSRIERRAVSWKMANADIQRIIAEAAAPLVSLATDKGLTLEVAEAAPLPVWADADRIQQVVTNLVGNAIKFSPPGGRIRIRVDRAPGTRQGSEPCALVAVSDTGPGISQSEREHLFQRFHRGSARQPAGSGTGLGLAISKEIVKQHGGEIWVESELGCGSTFYFTLPLRSKTEPTGERALGAESEGRG
jgi:signal transduction histidine kinase